MSNQLKQERLEEAFEFWSDRQSSYDELDILRFGAKWQQEKSYSEEEMISFGEFIFKHTLLAHSKGVKNLFEQFKKK